MTLLTRPSSSRLRLSSSGKTRSLLSGSPGMYSSFSEVPARLRVKISVIWEPIQWEKAVASLALSFFHQ